MERLIPALLVARLGQKKQPQAKRQKKHHR